MRVPSFAFVRIPVAMLAVAQFAAAAPETSPDQGGIGLEKDLSVTLERGDYRPKPMDDRTPLILRLESVKPEDADHFVYQFHYIAFEPGSYKLSDYLSQPDGTAAHLATETSIETGPIHVDSILPPNFQGELNPFGPRPFPWFGGYRVMLGGLAVLWLCGLPALIWLGRKKKAVVEEVIVPPLPTYAERMRPFVEAAAAGTLTTADQAKLERLMTGYWREKIGKPGQRMAGMLADLKKDPEAGALLRSMEQWLHHPGSISRAEIDRLLEPYGRPATTVTVGQEVTV